MAKPFRQPAVNLDTGLGLVARALGLGAWGLRLEGKTELLR
jgi:hypothetical protein